MIYKTTAGFPEQFIATEAITKGDCFSLSTVHLTETIIPPAGQDPGHTKYEIDKWYIRKFKGDKETMPLGVVLENVVKDGEIKKILIFRNPEFTVIVK